MEVTLLRQDKEWEIHKIRFLNNAWYIKLADGKIFESKYEEGKGNTETTAFVDIENLIEVQTGRKTFMLNNKREGILLAIKKPIKPAKIRNGRR